MELIPENGSNVANANSYATIEYIRKYAEDRGITELTPDDNTVAQFAIKAMDYLEAQRERFQGVPTYSTQPLQWPRQFVHLNGRDFPENEIPQELIQAQAALVVAVSRGVNLLPIRSKPPLRSVRLGPLGVDYDMNFGAISGPVVSAVDALLAPLFTQVSGLKVKRV